VQMGYTAGGVIPLALTQSPCPSPLLAMWKGRRDRCNALWGLGVG
jgi:hypothetical protein